MGCSAKQTRLNAQKSTGPRTERGKAIASKNATKHGILSKTPPLLITEDREYYDSLVSGLVETYAPVGPIEEMLIRQIAMVCLKQERLWSVEAAIANIEIIRQQKALNYPDKYPPQKFDKAWDLVNTDTPMPRRDVLKEELEFIRPYVAVMRSRLKLEHRGERVEEILTDLCDLRNEVAKHHDSDDFPWWDTVQNTTADGWQQLEDDFEEFSKTVFDVAKQIENRVSELENAIATIDQLDQAHDEARITQEGIQKPDLFARYQGTITRDLHLAIARLFDIQERRNGGSISSFGKN